ncbi:7741_t:CDS:2, partial [Acaulospora colombiana]
TSPISSASVDEGQQVEAYNAWVDTAINQEITGITQYQTSEPALTHQSGVGGTNTASSPNDGYAGYASAVKEVLQAGAMRLENAAARKR